MPNRGAHLVIALVVIALALIDAAAVETSQSTAAMERFLARPIVLHQYRAIRRLEASGGGQRGWLDAHTEFTPESGMQYSVIAEGGSGYVRGRILRSLLEQEQQLIASGRANGVALDRSNYQFTPESETAEGFARVTLRPLRKERALIAGEILLTPKTGELVRAQGQLAKNPSFWTKRVDVVRLYARINDVPVPISLQSTAELRLFGRSSLRMIYEYQEVDYRPVSPE